MSRVAWIFPGQGSQYVGMGKDLFDQYGSVRALFNQASEIAGKDLAKLCFEGPEEDLIKTENAQVGIFLVSAAVVNVLRESGQKPIYLAGHSLGELTAYYAAGVFDLATAIRLILARGAAMAASFPSEKSAMAAVMGLEPDKIVEVVKAFEPNAVVANFNSAGQLVISGEVAAVAEASEALKTAGAKRLIPLKVSGAFHSPFMQNASDTFKEVLEPVVFDNASAPIILNRTAEPETIADRLKENLPLQLKSSVKWMQSVSYLSGAVDLIVECGPGKVLAGLVKKTAPDIEVQSLSDPAGIAEFLASRS